MNINCCDHKLGGKIVKFYSPKNEMDYNTTTCTYSHFLDVKGVQRSRAHDHLQSLAVISHLGDLGMKSVDEVTITL